MLIDVYASLSPERLIKAGEKAGLPEDAINYLRHFGEVPLTLAVDAENGAVTDCWIEEKFREKLVG
jgi:hypothetical protein